MFFTIKNIETYEIHYIAPESFFEENLQNNYAVLLTGKEDLDIASFSIIGVDIAYDYKYFNNHILLKNSTVLTPNYDIKHFLKKLLEKTDFDKYKYPVNKIGMIGFFSYDFFQITEKIKLKTLEPYDFPLFNILFFKKYYLFDHREKKAFEIRIEYGDKIDTKRKKSTASYKYELENFLPEDKKNSKYFEQVKKVQYHIREGDVYELNLTKLFKASFFGNGFSLFKKIYEANNAPFSAYFSTPDYEIVSNSPELFFRAKDNFIETRPIKGTAPRGKTKEEDDKLKENLMNSTKEEAELFMITDLLRNDMNKVCKIGTVIVEKEKAIKKYQNVWQQLSVIKGELRTEFDYIDLFFAAFPGGSITGCPKKRAIELIDEIEKYNRKLYTGTIFIMNRNFLSSNIVIRTAIIIKNQLFLNSGGAITIDSNPKDELTELRTKIDNFFKVL